MTNPEDTTPANPAQGVSDEMVETVLKIFNSGLVTEKNDSDRGYTTFYRPESAMRAALTAAIGAGGQAVAVPLNPDMPAQEMRLHMGEMTAQEMRTARAAIRWANSALSQPHPADERVVEVLKGLLNVVLDMRDDNGFDASTCDAGGILFGDIASEAIEAAQAILSAQEGRKNG